MQAGAYGGSRHGVADSLTNEQYADAAARAMAQLNMGGYTEGLGLIQGDRSAQMAAQQANMGRDLSLAGSNAQLGTQVNLANAGAQNQWDQYSAGLQQQANMTNAQLAQQASQQNAANYLQGRGQNITENLGIGGLLGQQQGQNLNYALGYGNLNLNALQTGANILGQSSAADWFSTMNAGNVVGQPGGNTTTSPGSSPMNNFLGGAMVGWGITR